MYNFFAQPASRCFNIAGIWIREAQNGRHKSLESEIEGY